MLLSQVQTTSAWLHRFQWKAFELDRAQQEQDLHAIVEGLRSAARAVSDKLPASVFLLSHPSVYRPFYGALEQQILGERLSLAEAVRRYDLALYDVAREVERCHVLDIALLVGALGTDAGLEAETELLGEHLTRAGAGRVTSGLVRALHALDTRSPKVKCAVVDLDDTLWSGILREDGPAGVVVRHQALRALKILARRGIVLAICSKNDLAELEHLDALLGTDLLESIVCTELSWGPKSEGLKRIAQQLNIGLDTLAFFDDSERERAEVAMNAPQVRVFRDTDILRALSMPEFDPGPSLTSESANRARLYGAEAQRRAAQATGVASVSPEEFLHSLDLRLQLRPATAGELPRVAELLARTNQLNATVRRTDLHALQRTEDGHETFVAHLEDRFGDYGLIGASVVHWQHVVGELVEFAFSCRAMGRQVERAMLSYLLSAAMTRGVESLVVRFRSTDRNAELRKAFDGEGFSAVEVNESGELLSASSRELPSYPPWLDVRVL